MFSERLTMLRQERNLTQNELAEAVGISRSALSLYELNKREPDFSTLDKLALYFDVSSDFLLGRTSERRSSSNSTHNPTWLDKVSPELRTQIEDLIATGDMGGIYLRAGVGMAKDAQLVDYPPEALEAIAKAAIHGGKLIRAEKRKKERQKKNNS